MITVDDINAFGNIIDLCRELAGSVTIKVNKDLSYAFCVLYSKTLLTMCEIRWMLYGGYPEGAMALARNTYESLIILTYLYDNRDDQQLIERFLDDYSIKTCQDHINYLLWYIEHGNDDDSIQSDLSRRQKEWTAWQQKYEDYISKQKTESFFRQYWWAGKNMSFNKLRKATSYSASFLYDISCYRVHAGMTGMICFDNTEEGLLIGNVENGKEFPMFFSLLNFTIQTRLFFDIHHIDCESIFIKMDSLLKTINQYMFELESANSLD